MQEWFDWKSQRPPSYFDYKPIRWKAIGVSCLGRFMDVEWTEKQDFCGMGWTENEYWPPGSSWNGITRKLLAPYHWRMLDTDERTDKNITFSGLNLLPCPFTGKNPHIEVSTRYVGAPPFLLDLHGITVSSGIAKISGNDATTIEKHWNTRAEMIE